jgi:hypothetical protein
MTDTLRQRFPVFAAHEGVWQGTYKVIDIRTGELIDEHRSQVTIELAGENTYIQTNEYNWNHGRRVERQFQGEFIDDALHFDNERFFGQAFETKPNLICLYWIYKDKVNEKYSEIITLVTDTHRSRTWQHFENDQFVRVTIIDEHKIV